MAVDPVFGDNRTDVLKKLRMSSDIEDASNDVIDEVLLQVRTAIYKHLGADRVAEIKAYAYSESASTENEITRLMAAQTELYGLKAKLLRDAPVFFLEAKNDAQEAWNDDDLLRNAMGDEEAIAYYEGLFLRGLEALETGDEVSSPDRAIAFSPSHDAEKTIGRSHLNGKGLAGLWPSST